jgi:hypothetical protein
MLAAVGVDHARRGGLLQSGSGEDGSIEEERRWMGRSVGGRGGVPAVGDECRRSERRIFCKNVQ